MSDDIVKRLREGRTPGSHLQWTVGATDLEAADEIERLRADAAALREAGKRLLDNIDTGSYESEQQAVAEFRAALAAKEVEHDW